MNRMECANCLVHSWKQPEESALLQCSNCKLIYYCGKECQLEHWIKVHKDQCKYFADPSLNEPWQHREKDCIICLKAALVGESSIKRADNPNYDCVLRAPFPPNLIHPHPFPVTGQSGDIREKAIIVLIHLVRKFQLTHPEVAVDCHEELLALKLTLGRDRVRTWRARKIYPQPKARFYDCTILEEMSAIENKMVRIKILQDPFQLWYIISLMERIINSERLNNELRFFKDPLADLPDGIKKLVSKCVDNANEYFAMADKILDALTNQVIPYREVLKIVGGGSLMKECSFCSKEMDISSEESSVYLTQLLLGVYTCGSKACEEEGDAARDDQCKLEAALMIMSLERKANICDFCFKRTPVKQAGADMRDIHRCRHCYTVMYCSRDCLHKDDAVHVKVCQKDKEGRKKKPNGSARRRMAKEEIEKMFQYEDSNLQNEVLKIFKLKYSEKELENEVNDEINEV